MLVEVGCVGVVSDSSGGSFVVVVVVLEDGFCGVGMRGRNFCNVLV